MLAMLAVPVLAIHRSSNDVNVENDNYARVSNNVTVVATTGDNIATTGEAEKGGVGSEILTGNAGAEANVVTVANTNLTKVNAPCTRNCSGDVNVENEDNDAFVRNRVRVIAETGDNLATTGEAEKGGMGSYIQTGNAWSEGNVITVTNTNITRVSRGR